MSAQPIRRVRTVAVLGLVATLLVPAGAAAPPRAAQAGYAVFPTTIPLPDGFQPEGVAIGAFPSAYPGSLADGSIYRATLITGEGRIVSPGPGTPSVGLDLDRRGRLFVAGGAAGDARVVSAVTGEVLASYPLGGGFVNDVIVTPDAAWLTDSLNPVLYRLPLGRHGRLPAPDEAVTVPLTGDLVLQPGLNANGISRTPDGAGLLVVQTNTGLLFRVEPSTGFATEVDLDGETVPNGDTLYVVQNRLNQVAVVRLDRAGTGGTVAERLTDRGSTCRPLWPGSAGGCSCRTRATPPPRPRPPSTRRWRCLAADRPA